MAGFRELLAVEYHRQAAQYFRRNLPSVAVHEGDVTALDAAAALRLAGISPGELDVLDGSPPCQGFSTAGSRNFEDRRNQLFRHYCRLVRAFRPRGLVMENVSGMVKGKMKLIFAEILEELRACGYRVRCRLLNAKWFGVPQSRQRLIFLGLRSDLAAEPGFPEPETLEPYTLAEALVGLSRDEMDPATGHVWVDERARDTLGFRMLQSKATPQGAKVHPGSVQTRARWDRPANTICCNVFDGTPPYIRNSPIHPSEPRTLSIRELARLCSFRDAYHLPDALRYGMQRVGNSVPPLMMRAIARRLRADLEALGGTRTD